MMTNATTANVGNYQLVAADSAGMVTSAVVVVSFDTDGLGLPDAWQIQYFGEIGISPTADPEGDGIDNYQAYLDGDNPTNANLIKPFLNLSGTPGGTVSATPLEPYYQLGSTVQIMAVPNPGYSFVGWSGSITNTNATVGVVMNTTETITGNFGLPLSQVLDDPYLVWTTGGNRSWFGETKTSYDGISAAQSGVTLVGQQSWLQTIITNTALSYVYFEWAVSSFESNYLSFYVNGNNYANISGGEGNIEWQLGGVYLPPGTNVLQWVYAENYADNDYGWDNLDSGWLDEVHVVPEPSVLGWGYNNSGSIEPPGLTNLVEIASGWYHNLALESNGVVVAWGDNSYGESTIPVGLTNVIAIAAGYDDSLALEANGTVVAWGDDGYGETGVPVGLTSVAAIAAGKYHSLALMNSGTVAGWGDNSYGETTVPVGLNNVVAIAAGAYHSLALMNNGTVVGWGDNSYGECTMPAGLTNVIAIAAGYDDSLALEANGTVVAWGYNGYGETSVPAGLTSVLAIAAGEYHSLALLNNGTVVGWGDNSYGESISFAGITNIVAIAAGYDDSLALVGNGSPFISQQPVNTFAYGGNTVELVATATGAWPLNYQWNYNGSPISGATNSWLIFNDAPSSISGAYSLTVSNGLRTVTSSNAILTVITPQVIAVLDGGLSSTNMIGTGSGSSANATVSANFTVSSGASVMVVELWDRDAQNIAPSPSFLTWSNAITGTTQALTLAVGQVTTTTTYSWCNIYYLYNPMPGPGTVSGTDTNSTLVQNQTMMVFALSGVNTTLPPATYSTAALATNLSVNSSGSTASGSFAAMLGYDANGGLTLTNVCSSGTVSYEDVQNNQEQALGYVAGLQGGSNTFSLNEASGGIATKMALAVAVFSPAVGTGIYLHDGSVFNYSSVSNGVSTITNMLNITPGASVLVAELYDLNVSAPPHASPSFLTWSNMTLGTTQLLTRAISQNTVNGYPLSDCDLFYLWDPTPGTGVIIGVDTNATGPASMALDSYTLGGVDTTANGTVPYTAGNGTAVDTNRLAVTTPFSTMAGSWAPTMSVNYNGGGGNFLTNTTSSGGAYGYNFQPFLLSSGEDSALQMAMGYMTNLAAGVSTITASASGGNTYMALAAMVLQPLPGTASPTNLTATGQVNQVALSWDDASGGQAISYIIYRSTLPSSGFAPIGTTTTPMTNYTDRALSNWTTYYYSVTATGPNGISVNSAVISATAGGVPGNVTGLTATNGVYAVQLNWADTGSSNFTILRAANTPSGFTTLASDVSGTNGVSAYRDTSVAEATLYYYEIQPVNYYGTGSLSAVVSAIPCVALFTNWITIATGPSCTVGWVDAGGTCDPQWFSATAHSLPSPPLPSTGYLVVDGFFGTNSGAHFCALVTNFPAQNFSTYTALQLDIQNVGAWDEYNQIQAIMLFLNCYGTYYKFLDTTGPNAGYQGDIVLYEQFDTNINLHLSLPMSTLAAGANPSSATAFELEIYDANVNTNVELDVGFANIAFTGAPGYLPVYTNLSSPAISPGTTSVTLTGSVGSLVGGVPFYLAPNTPITATINGVTESGTIDDATGDFSINFTGTGGWAAGQYTITYTNASDQVAFVLGTGADTLTVGTPVRLPRIGVLDGAPVNWVVNGFGHSSTTISANFTVSSGASVLVVSLFSRDDDRRTDPFAGNVTYGGVPLTEGVWTNNGGSTYASSDICYLWNPPAGTQTITANDTSGSTPSAMTMQAYTLSGVDTTLAPVTYAAQNAATTSVAVSLSPATPAWAWAVVNSSYGTGGISMGVSSSSGQVNCPCIDNVTEQCMGYVANLNAGASTITAAPTNGAGGQKMALVALVFTPAFTAAPTNVVATGLANAIKLTWDDATAGAATNYIVLRSTTSGVYTAMATNNGNASTSYIDTSVVNYTIYYYMVQAQGPTGLSADSSPASAYAVTAPPTPVILPVSLDSTHTNLAVKVVTASGHNYYLESTASLNPPVVWTTNSVTAGTGGTITNLVPITSAMPKQYFRYLVQ
ncbi:MAG: hypothetical protein ABSE16_01680 [Verrucomicrobiota bacterium]